MLKNLKKIRSIRGLTQKELAYRAHITQQTLASYESKGTTPSCHTLIQLAKILGTSTDYLLGLTDSDEYESLKNDNKLSDQEAYVVNEFRRMDSSSQEWFTKTMEAVSISLGEDRNKS